MKTTTFGTLKSIGYPGTERDPARIAIDWLSTSGRLRIEPYWRFLGSDPGFSWSKSWEVYSEKVEVQCETWEELLEIALERSVVEAFE